MPNKNEEHALAELAIHSAHSQQADHGEPATHEELALMAEGKLTKARREQVLEQLNVNNELYRTWIGLQEVYQADSPAVEPEKVKPKFVSSDSLIEKLSQWFNELFTFPVGAATAFGLVAGLAIGLGLLDKQNSQSLDGEVAFNEAFNAPEKASNYRAPASVSKEQEPMVQYTSDMTDRLNDAFNCVSVAPAFDGSLCVSETENKQHWLLLSNEGMVQALESPIQAGLIHELYPSDDGQYLSVITVDEGHMTLSVLSVDRLLNDTEGGDGVLVFSDSLYPHSIEVVGWGDDGFEYRFINTEQSPESNIEGLERVFRPE